MQNPLRINHMHTILLRSSTNDTTPTSPPITLFSNKHIKIDIKLPKVQTKSWAAMLPNPPRSSHSIVKYVHKSL